jgi:hypothetical protein
MAAKLSNETIPSRHPFVGWNLVLIPPSAERKLAGGTFRKQDLHLDSLIPTSAYHLVRNEIDTIHLVGMSG